MNGIMSCFGLCYPIILHNQAAFLLSRRLLGRCLEGIALIFPPTLFVFLQISPQTGHVSLFSPMFSLILLMLTIFSNLSSSTTVYLSFQTFPLILSLINAYLQGLQQKLVYRCESHTHSLPSHWQSDLFQITLLIILRLQQTKYFLIIFSPQCFSTCR